MATDYLLDTGLAYLVAANDPSIQMTVRAAGQLYVPSIVIGELYQGAYRIETTRRGQLLLAQYNQLLTTVAVLPCDTVTALIFARLRVDLDTAGKRIPLHDTWIAALAKQYSLTIATRDAHFDVVPGVIVERW